MILAVVGIGITVAVYGAVAMIVKADDVGVALARRESAVLRAVGGGLVRGMPVFLKVLAAVGMAAMLWVGGGIILHGLEEFGLGGLPHLIHGVAQAVGGVVPGVGGVLAWLVGATLSGLFGLAVGFAVIPLTERVLVPAWRLVRRGPG
jgi:predicted DNA repair protein MutK